jgi:Ceramidase
LRKVGPDLNPGPLHEMWSTPIDLYCERVTPSFWAEPVNALSNVAFLIAAFAAFGLWQREGKGDRPILALIVVTAAVGLGSFAFHTLATRGAMLLDITPIGIFIYGYFLLALRRFLLLSWPVSLTLLISFIALSLGLASLVPRQVLNGSSGYFPALAALIVLGWMLRRHEAGRAMLVAAGLFVVSVLFRIVDLDVCTVWPLGTHFLWHLFNAAVLYTVLRGAIAERQRALGQELR